MKSADAIQSGNELSSACDNTNAAIDAEVLYSRCMGNVSMAMALIGELELSGTKQVNKILQSAAASDIAGTAEGAHALKGAAAIVGAQALSHKAAQVEAAGRAGEADCLLNLLEELEEEMSRCISYIPKLRQQFQRPQ